MVLKKPRKPSVYLLLGILVGLCCIKTCILMSERIKQMNNQKSGQFSAHDKNGKQVIVTWKQTGMMTPSFAQEMAGVWDIACPAYTPVEMQFLKSHPEIVGNEQYFTSFEALFADGFNNVDWDVAEKKMQEILKGHFVFDASKFNDAMIKMFEKDMCYFVSVRDAMTNELLGFASFLVRSNYKPGDVKVMTLGVDPVCQNRGLGKLLMSTIFKILPDLKRLFLCTRVTNENALRAYGRWGFIIDPEPVLDHGFNLDHWTFMEYKPESSKNLQIFADNLIG